MVSWLCKGLWTTGFVLKGLIVHPSFWDELRVVVDRLIVIVFPRGGSWSGETKKLFEWSKYKHIILKSYHNLRWSSIIAIVCKAWFLLCPAEPLQEQCFLGSEEGSLHFEYHILASSGKFNPWIKHSGDDEHDLFWTWTTVSKNVNMVPIWPITTL